MAAATAALCLNINPSAICEGVGRLETVSGRLETVKNKRHLNIIVDYAHTPDALLKSLKALHPLLKGRMITVFGCGGNRDQGKRHEMGHIAGENSDLVVITSDNPRTEDPIAIISQIEAGVKHSGLNFIENPNRDQWPERGYAVEVDRHRAIQKAIGAARSNDIVLIAGKGHEDYQIIGMEKRPFDDRKVIQQTLDCLAGPGD